MKCKKPLCRAITGANTKTNSYIAKFASQMVAWESVRFLTAHAKTDVKNVLPLNKHHLMAFSVAYRSLKATSIGMRCQYKKPEAMLYPNILPMHPNAPAKSIKNAE